MRRRLWPLGVAAVLAAGLAYESGWLRASPPVVTDTSSSLSESSGTASAGGEPAQRAETDSDADDDVRLQRAEPEKDPENATPDRALALTVPPTQEEHGAPSEPPSEAEAKNRSAVDLAAKGDWTAAIPLLRDARTLAPDNELYGRNLQAALINAGFAAIASEHFDEAAGHFNEARRLGDRPEIDRGLGYAYYRLGNVDLARTTLEQALTTGGDDAETLLTLGRIYLERHDQEHALAMLDRAIAAGADRAGLAATVERLRRDADAERGMQSLGSSHFVLKFEGHENVSAGRIVLNELEDAYRRVGARFAYYPLERLEVILYPDEQFRAITNSPHWSGAVYDGRIKLPVGGLARGNESVGRTLRHEYAHAAIVTLSRGKAPVWLNEGLAQVAEEVDEAGRAGRLRMALASDGLAPLSALESGFTQLGREDASLAYAEAYFAADYLLRKKGGYNVRRLLEALATAATIDDAFRQSLSLPYADFERQFLRDVTQHVG